MTQTHYWINPNNSYPTFYNNSYNPHVKSINPMNKYKYIIIMVLILIINLIYYLT